MLILGTSVPYFIPSVWKITWYISFIYLSLGLMQMYLTLNTAELATLTSWTLCVCVLVIQKPGKFYIVFSNLYSFAARTVRVFHKYWRKKAVTLIFERTKDKTKVTESFVQGSFFFLLLNFFFLSFLFRKILIYKILDYIQWQSSCSQNWIQFFSLITGITHAPSV